VDVLERGLPSIVKCQNVPTGREIERRTRSACGLPNPLPETEGGQRLFSGVVKPATATRARAALIRRTVAS
jgi:hypothetical protein